MPDLVLYQFSSCPFCRRVLHYIQQRGLDIPIRDTMRDPGAREELIEIGGSSQVPCLVIDGEALYESMDIIAWLDQNV